MDTPTTEIYTLSLHDALPISRSAGVRTLGRLALRAGARRLPRGTLRGPLRRQAPGDRKSTRLNSSHLGISYAVFCLKKKTDRTTGLSPSSARSATARYKELRR